MKLTTHIRNLIFLWRQKNKTEIPKNADAEVILRVTKNTYKRKKQLGKKSSSTFNQKNPQRKTL